MIHAYSILEAEWMKLMQHGNYLTELEAYFKNMTDQEWKECKTKSLMRWNMQMIKCKLSSLERFVGIEISTILVKAAEQLKSMCKCSNTKEECWSRFEPYWDDVLKENINEVQPSDLIPIQNWLQSKSKKELAAYAEVQYQDLWKADASRILRAINKKGIVVDDWINTLYQFFVRNCPSISELAKLGFQEKYVDPFHNLQVLSSYLSRCAEKYELNPHDYIAPYFSICQSSGYGKSRLITELAKTRPVLYISFKRNTRSG